MANTPAFYNSEMITSVKRVYNSKGLGANVTNISLFKIEDPDQ
jgi:hypothetical protein